MLVDTFDGIVQHIPNYDSDTKVSIKQDVLNDAEY